MSTYEAFSNLIQNSVQNFAFMSQWAIDGSGKDKYLFKSLVKAVKNNVSLEIGYNNHANFMMQRDYSPVYLQKMQNFNGQVKIYQPNIEGKITKNHQGNMIHSKIYISDE